MKECIAERKLFSISPNWKNKSLRIAIGKPYQVDDYSWACSVNIDGLNKKLTDIIGIDSWQALNLALALVKQLLGYYINDGARIFWKQGGEEILLNDLFPQLKSS